MIRRWLCWLLAALGALALRVAYTGWLAGFVLAGVLCLPVMGLLLSLPAILSAKVELSPDPGKTRRGERACWRVVTHSTLGLPLGRIKGNVKTVNEWNGLVYQIKKSWFFTGAGTSLDLPAPAVHCGLLTGKLSSVWALDCLGLFWLPLRRGGTAQLWVGPVPKREELPPLPREETPGVRPRPGGGPGEDYDPREYRPGDPLNSIHWKLSAKRDELVTRETLETVRPLPLVTLDLFGDPDTLDATLDLLAGVSGELLSRGRSHAVAWADPETGEVRRCPIAGEEDLERCLEVLTARRAPLTGRSILDLAGVGKSLHLTVGYPTPDVPPTPDSAPVGRDAPGTPPFTIPTSDKGGGLQ